MKHISKKALVILSVVTILASSVSCGIRRTGVSDATTDAKDSTVGGISSGSASGVGSGTDGSDGSDGSDGTGASTDASTTQTHTGTPEITYNEATEPPATTVDTTPPDNNTTTPPDTTDKGPDNYVPIPSGDTNTQSVSIDSFPSSYNEFLSKTVFVGDSICSGLRVYKILPSDNVMAVGNVGARSIFDYTFNAKGTEYALPDALALLNPAYVVCSMGMNDVNMTSAEKFCENYDNVLAKIHQTLPNAKIYVVSITPIAASSNFCANTKLDSYNEALRSHLSGTAYTYLDVASIMKNADGALADENNGGDGIHLSPAAYKSYLKRICELTVK